MDASDSDWFYTRGVFETPLDQIVLTDSSGSDIFHTLQQSRSGRTLVIIITLLTQVLVLAVVAMTMGIAVTTMWTLLGEIFVIIAVGAALERQVITFSDLATILEVSATVVVTGATVFYASVNSLKLSEGHIQASKFL